MDCVLSHSAYVQPIRSYELVSPTQTKSVMQSISANCSRRRALEGICVGFGGLALKGLIASEAYAGPLVDGLTPRPPFFEPRAKRVIFLFMHGGPSHIDLFDPKPQLTKHDGRPLPFDGSRVTFADRGNLMKSPWKFSRHGEHGLPMSELWEHLPSVADELCMLHSVCETNVAHGGACMKMHTGDEDQVRPSVGAWISYGLGTENNNLPGFITICPTTLHGGVNNFGSAFPSYSAPRSTAGNARVSQYTR